MPKKFVGRVLLGTVVAECVAMHDGAHLSNNPRAHAHAQAQRIRATLDNVR